MHIVMQCIGGLLDGHHEFTDNNDMIPRVRYTKDRNLALAMLVYHFTNGQIGHSSEGTSPPVFEQAIRTKLTQDQKLAGLQYQIASREENADTNTVTIVAKCVAAR